MCYGRRQDRQIPACASACPQMAIEIETINIAEWVLAHGAAHSPGLPATEHTISTTRITLPEDMPPSSQPADSTRGRPENPHPPFIVMLVLTQLSMGFVSLWLAGPAGSVATRASLLVGLPAAVRGRSGRVWPLVEILEFSRRDMEHWTSFAAMK